jgi:hypothetical protein
MEETMNPLGPVGPKRSLLGGLPFALHEEHVDTSREIALCGGVNYVAVSGSPRRATPRAAG